MQSEVIVQAGGIAQQGNDPPAVLFRSRMVKGFWFLVIDYVVKAAIHLE